MIETARLPDHTVTPFLTAYAVHSAGSVVVTLSGELDVASSGSLQREVLSLFALPIDSVTLDLGALTFLDSSGLNLLNRVRVAATDHGIALDLRCVPDHVRRVLDVTGMDVLFALS